jgi:hypothetical protein
MCICQSRQLLCEDLHQRRSLRAFWDVVKHGMGGRLLELEGGHWQLPIRAWLPLTACPAAGKVWMWTSAAIIRRGRSALAGAAGRDAQGISQSLISRRV